MLLWSRHFCFAYGERPPYGSAPSRKRLGAFLRPSGDPYGRRILPSAVQCSHPLQRMEQERVGQQLKRVLPV